MNAFKKYVVCLLAALLLGSLGWQSAHRIHHFEENKSKHCALFTETSDKAVLHHSHGDLSLHCDSCTLAVISDLFPTELYVGITAQQTLKQKTIVQPSNSWINKHFTYKSLRAPPTFT